MKLSVGVLLLIALQATPAGGMEKPLETRELQAAASETDAFRARDTFAAPPDHSKLIGRRFKIELPLPHNRMPGWNYSASEQELSLILMPTFRYLSTSPPESWRKALPPGGQEGWSFFDTVSHRSQYSATNAFGVGAKVTSEAGREYGLIPFSAPDHDWELKIAMSPAEARVIAPRLRLRIEGTVRAVANNQAVTCFQSYSEPTLSNPRERLIRQCLVATEIDKIAVVDGGSERVFKDWSRTTSAR